MKILAIESSCDETAAAVVSGSGEILANAVATQIDAHAAFGGVVPEIASRCHVELVEPVVNQALREAGLSLADLDGIAVTQGPGLIGALLVGIAYAKSLAYALNVPLVGVNHLEGHMAAARIEHQVNYPHLGMVVSGGHTSIYRCDSPSQMVQIGQTLDDAAGEAFDKVAKLLNLGYPGGVVIDKLSQGVDHSFIKLPRPLINDGTYNFSFSGLKTAVLNAVIENEIFPELELRFAGIPVAKQVNPGKEPVIAKIAAAFQAAAVDVIATKLIRACADLGLNQIVVAGGVACNSALRAELRQRGGERGIKVLIPHPRYCTDNAAMIGVASLRHFEAGNYAPLSTNAVSRWADLA